MEEEWKVEDKKKLMEIGSVSLKKKCGWCGRITHYPIDKNGNIICSDCLGRYFGEEHNGPWGSYRRGD